MHRTPPSYRVRPSPGGLHPHSVHPPENTFSSILRKLSKAVLARDFFYMHIATSVFLCPPIATIKTKQLRILDLRGVTFISARCRCPNTPDSLGSQEIIVVNTALSAVTNHTKSLARAGSTVTASPLGKQCLQQFHV